MTHFQFIAGTTIVAVLTAVTSAAAEPAPSVEMASLETPSSDAARPVARDLGAEKSKASPFQLSLWNPVQTIAADSAIYGMRLNLPYGVNREVRGFDFGIASRTSGNLLGAQLGLVGMVDRNLRGVQLSLVYSAAQREMFGLQLAAYGSAGRLRGLQAGLVNHVDGSARGAQLGVVNLAEGSSTGASIGVVNYSPRVTGLQLGLVNRTGELRGVQIGVANFANNGFLPFFPVINAAH